ncbi:DUF2752 domain-containing protein [Sphingobacterium sp. SRCM116780]|uniref:DUF2752 domain-containing protein n=1 Tax=Sphingobacterium sp. SRCM116780 TaxID=2907623 RepID=UPI001F2F068D|nr:DUF2752 domain-containing protein [Sphingobacterium sp. SRCM116780]UIR57890.1 DUF2752 domain-containing protein [Sphingobacterium sp. SRCM116780]
MVIKKSTRFILAILGLGILIVIYKNFNPVQYALFPKCPVYAITGYKCPGCGSQRAVHYLLNFDLQNALKENLLLVIAIPYIITGFVFESIKQPNEKVLKWRKIIFGYQAIIIVFLIVISFWILRNC